MEQPINKPNLDDADKKISASGQDIKVSLKSLLANTKSLLKEVLQVKEGIEIQGTIDGIKKEIDFKGYNIWILICSIIIASVGLNLNSTAVIIGAMLISPLMGPILGIGLAVGTNDGATLFRSLRSFGIMVAVGLISATLYFFLSPIREVTPELLSRTRPTILDVFVAIFGGTAGIIASSRKEKTNVIPGVAIATALMPPLCTAGFGLATGKFNFFFGAMYLFLLNSVFISAATFLFVRYLKFPLVQFVNSTTEKRVKRYIIIFTILVVVPSTWLFWGVMKESYFRNKSELFIAENIKMEDARIVKSDIIYNDSLSVIELFLMGERVSDQVIQNWSSRLENYNLKNGWLIKNTKLIVNQPKDMSNELAGKVSQEVRVGIIEDMYKENRALLEDKSKRIDFLEDQIMTLKSNDIDVGQIQTELKIQYSNLDYIAYASLSYYNNGKSLSKPTVFVMPKKDKNIEQKDIQQIRALLKVRLNKKELDVIEMNN